MGPYRSPSHPLTLSPSHPLTRSSSHPLTLSPTHPLTRAHPLTRSPAHPLTLTLSLSKPNPGRGTRSPSHHYAPAGLDGAHAGPVQGRRQEPRTGDGARQPAGAARVRQGALAQAGDYGA
eukprot:6975037-Prymnesium_polylepis.1